MKVTTPEELFFKGQDASTAATMLDHINTKLPMHFDVKEMAAQIKLPFLTNPVRSYLSRILKIHGWSHVSFQDVGTGVHRKTIIFLVADITDKEKESLLSGEKA